MEEIKYIHIEDIDECCICYEIFNESFKCTRCYIITNDNKKFILGPLVCLILQFIKMNNGNKDILIGTKIIGGPMNSCGVIQQKRKHTTI